MNVNFIAILAAAVSSMVLGFLWYGPLFGKPWMKLSGITPQKKGMSQTYALSFVGAIVMAYVLSNFIGFSGATDYTSAGMIGFWAWLGFVGPVQMTDVLFGGKSWNLYFINTGYQLVSLIIMGMVLSYF